MIYVIAPRNEVTQAMIDASMGQSLDGLRSSVYGSDRVILKFQGAAPDSVSGYTQYNASQIKDILEDPDGDWVPFTDIDDV
jgi:hypothetical protein